jgi:hypothetical protein
MTRSHIVLASGLSAFTGMTLAGIVSASAQVYIDEGAYTVPPAYGAPAVPPAYYVAPPGYVAAAPTYAAPAAPLAVVPVTPPAYAAAPAHVPRGRVTRHVIVERRPAYPRYDYGYVTYEDW